MSITIKDVAREAGVSHTSVSRTLHNHLGIPSQTTRRIQITAAQMSYPSGAAASSLKTSRSKTLGVILGAPLFRAEPSRTFQAYLLPITVINNRDAENYQYSIYHEDLFGSRHVISHFLALGHRRCLPGPAPHHLPPAQVSPGRRGCPADAAPVTISGRRRWAAQAAVDRPAR